MKWCVKRPSNDTMTVECIAFLLQRGRLINNSDLVEDGLSDTKKLEFLAGGGMAAITIRTPKYLRDAGKEARTLKGVSFSAFIRMCMIDELVKKGQ